MTKEMKKTGTAGFTLIELMIVVAIIGILAAIAIPKFADLIRESKEGATKGNLGSIRSAMSIYYGDQQGVYPTAINSLTENGKYLTAIPSAQTPPYHATSSSENDGSTVGDSGMWFFDNGSGDTNYGTVLVDCTHTDTVGNTWSTY